MSIALAQRSALGAFIRSTLAARTAATGATPWGEISTQLYVDGRLCRQLDVAWFQQIYSYMDDVAPPSIVLRFQIAADFDAKWKTQAELEATSFWNFVANKLYINSAPVPTAAITRVGDKVLEADLTPQVSGGTVSPDQFITSMRSASYMVKMDGSPITSGELPLDGDVVQAQPGHFLQSEKFSIESTPLRADGLGNYYLRVDGTTTLVTSGHSAFAPVGIAGFHSMAVNADMFDDILLDFGATSALSGETVGVVPQSLGLPYMRLVEHADTTGDDADMIAGLVASFEAGDGIAWRDAQALNEGTKFRLRFDPGYAPRASAIYTSPFKFVSNSRPTRDNPYPAPYDSNLTYGFLFHGGRDMAIVDEAGAVIGFLADIENSIPSYVDSDGNWIQVGSSPDVFVAWNFASEAAAVPNAFGAIRMVIIDPAATTGDTVWFNLNRDDLFL